MKHKYAKTIAFLIASLISSGYGNAQSSINAAGGDGTGIGGSIAYSIGQVVYTTEASATAILAQGVQHSRETYALLDAAAVNILFDKPVTCEGPHEIKAVIANNGTIDINTLTIEWEVNNVPQSPILYSQTLYAPGNPLGSNNDTIILGTENFQIGIPLSISFKTSNPNGLTDDYIDNDQFTSATISATDYLPTADGISIVDNGTASFALKIDNPNHVDSFYWDFGDGTTGEFDENFNLSHPYHQQGNYQVTVILRNDCGDLVLTSAPFFSLPVEMSPLKGDVNSKNQAQLSWKTFSERNNIGFRIEHSKDGRNFQDIDFVATLTEDGNSHQALLYNFLDPQSLTSTSYYRIVQIDADAKYTYSNIVNLSPNGQAKEISMVVYPNPTSGRLKVELAGDLGAYASIKVLDLIGREVLTKEVTDSQFDLDLGSLSSGTYMLHYQDSKSKAIFKVSKD